MLKFLSFLFIGGSFYSHAGRSNEILSTLNESSPSYGRLCKIHVANIGDNTVSEIVNGDVVKNINIFNYLTNIGEMKSQPFMSKTFFDVLTGMLNRDEMLLGGISEAVKKEVAQGAKEDLSITAEVGESSYVLNLKDESVSEFVHGKLTQQIKVGKNPWMLMAAGKDLYVANFGSHTVSEIIDGTKKKDIGVGTHPIDLAMIGKAIYVANFGSHTVSEIIDGKKMKDITVGINPRSLVVLKPQEIPLVEERLKTAYQERKLTNVVFRF